MSLAATETLQFDAISITVREWTLAEIRAHLVTQPSGAEVDLLDVATVEGFHLRDIPRFTSATREDLEALTPTEVRRVVEAIQRVNADFFRICALAVKLAEEARQAAAQTTNATG